MRTSNKTTFLFAAVPGSLRPPEPTATLVVKATFRLRLGEPVLPLEGIGAQGMLSGDVFATGDDDRRGALLHASDFATFKLAADVLVSGRCHTPGHKPLAECPVRVSMGAWSKTLRVVGRRVWSGVIDAVPSDPVPFTEMPLDYAHAFGGPSYADNPVGRGVDTPELHNVEAPGDVVRGRRDRITPASFAPLSPYWPPRAAKVGKSYGKSWEEKRAPYVAEDFDWAFFNAAPVDQRVPYLQGDEEIAFLNLHPAAPSFSARLPGIRVRVFLLDDRDRAREVTMRIDTLHADLEREVLALTWRGVDAVREDDLRDLRAALVVREPHIGPARSAEGCIDELRAFAADPVGVAKHKEALARRREELLGPLGVEPPEVAPTDPLSRAVAERLDALPAPLRERVRLSLARASEMEAPGHDVGQAVLGALMGPPQPGAPPLAIPRKPGAQPYVPIGHRLRPVREQLDRLRAQNDVMARLPERDREALAKLDALDQSPFVQKLDPYTFRPGQDEPGPGADLSGRDLSGQSFDGRDLSGANLSGALLQGATFKKANLRGAVLKHAILYEADLSGADLTKADLEQATLVAAKARLAVFREANLEAAVLERADLSGADLSGAAGAYAAFSKADLSDAVARGAKLHKAFFDGAVLTRLDASGATLTSCRMVGASAEGARFSGATLDRSSFERAILREAVFVQARGERVTFRRAVLEGADLRSATFPEAFFDEAKADGAKLGAASLRGARFHRTSLVRADAAQADLLGGDLSKADLRGASFAGASLYRARMRLTRREGCDFAGANLTRVVTDGRSPPEG